MTQVETEKDEQAATKKDDVVATDALTVDELIRSQLQGKSKALERYDLILWKIRAGYLAVLYGLLTLLSGKEVEDVLGAIAKIEVLFLTASFSLCAFVIDLGFLVSKLRVVDARDDLSDLALRRAKEGEKTVLDPLKDLLHLSGEAPGFPRLTWLLNRAWPIFSISLLYVTTPATIAIFRAFASHAGIEP